MFTLVYGDDLFDFPKLANDMFVDRRVQFHEQLGWNLNIDAQGREIDEYDLMNPLYLILRDESGRHLGSCRALPTTGPTMIADHFSDLTGGVQIESPLIWEVTRVFVANRDRNAVRHAAALMWGGCQVGLRAGVEFFVSVTPKAMTRVFSACGWPPEIIGEEVSDKDGHLCACLWEVTEENAARLADKARLDAEAIKLEVYRRNRRATEADVKDTVITPAGVARPGWAPDLHGVN